MYPLGKQFEIDFVCNQGSKRYYIQSALNIDTPEKTLQESKSFPNIIAPAEPP